MQHILKSANAANVPAGVHVVAPSIRELTEKIDSGYRFVPYSIDSVMLRSEVEKVMSRV